MLNQRVAVSKATCVKQQKGRYTSGLTPPVALAIYRKFGSLGGDRSTQCEAYFSIMYRFKIS